MNVLKNIEDKCGKIPQHMTLIDPATSGSEKSAFIASEAERAGTDYILIGGSTDIGMELMEKTISLIKEKLNIPVLIFPGSAKMIARNADALLFMSLLNSSDPEFIIWHQKEAAFHVKMFGIETISMGYIVVEPGMTVGRVGKAMLIGEKNMQEAPKYALAAELLGMKMIYLEAGSGAHKPVPTEMIKMVKEAISIPLIVGGGIRTEMAAEKAVKSGADIIVTGTIAEKSENVFRDLHPIIRKIKMIQR
ncbi:phosphoglycerol geranylgeranyltransferase [Caldiplasma sukawensis]